MWMWLLNNAINLIQTQAMRSRQKLSISPWVISDRQAFELPVSDVLMET